MSTTSIPGVDHPGLASAIHYNTRYIALWSANIAADVALAYIAAHHKCDCEREHADEWVEVDKAAWAGLPCDAQVRQEFVRDRWGATVRLFVQRNDLPDPDADLVERMAKAIFASDFPDGEWGSWSADLQEAYRENARAALAAYREGDR